MDSVAVIAQVGKGTPRAYRVVTQIREEALLVPEEMNSHKDIPGYGSIFKHYSEIVAATKQLQLPDSYNLHQMIGPISLAGWASLEFADEVLAKVSVEKRLNSEAVARYINEISGLIDEILADESLSAPDRDRIVRLLREVESALLTIQIFGANRVEEAAVTVAGVMRVEPDLWDRIASKRWITRFGVVIGGLLFALGSVGGLPALGMGLGEDDHPPEVVVRVEETRSGESTDQPQRMTVDSDGVVDVETVDTDDAE